MTAAIASRRDTEFTDTIIHRSGSNVLLCYQCQKCASGCPVVFAMDKTPPQIIHAVRLGLKDFVLSTNTPWICASCKACSVRCPQGIDVAKVMDEVRGAALREGRMPEDREIVHFYKSVKDNIRIFGRMYEIGMMGELKLLSGEYTKDMGLGLKMIARGKLKLFPDLASLGRMEKVFKAVEKMEGMV